MNETVQEWIRYIDECRKTNVHLARGHWHGYMDAPGGAAPMRGRYYLVRWETPTVAVSHDDWSLLIGLASTIEEAFVASHDAEHGVTQHG
jgi:hypothetical protein